MRATGRATAHPVEEECETVLIALTGGFQVRLHGPCSKDDTHKIIQSMFTFSPSDMKIMSNH